MFTIFFCLSFLLFIRYHLAIFSPYPSVKHTLFFFSLFAFFICHRHRLFGLLHTMPKLLQSGELEDICRLPADDTGDDMLRIVVSAILLFSSGIVFPSIKSLSVDTVTFFFAPFVDIYSAVDVSIYSIWFRFKVVLPFSHSIPLCLYRTLFAFVPARPVRSSSNS